MQGGRGAAKKRVHDAQQKNMQTNAKTKPLVGRPPAPPRARFLPRILKKELTRGREAGSIRFRRFRREDGEAREAKPPEPAP